MRTLLFVILISGQCFGQIVSRQSEIRYPGKIDSIIVGDWLLKETIIKNAYGKDTVSAIRDVSTQNKTITFTKDSLIINPYTTRYYVRLDRFEYKIVDSEINLYKGKKKERKHVNWYGIIVCSPRELIIYTEDHYSDGLDINTIRVYHVYHRKQMNQEYETLLNNLSKTWILCTNQNTHFLSSDTVVKLDFTNKDTSMNQHRNCGDSLEHIELSFYRNEKNSQNSIKGSWGSPGEGLIIDFPIYFDYNFKNIIIPGNKHLAYKFELTALNQLSLELNKELTDQLNKEYP